MAREKATENYLIVCLKLYFTRVTGAMIKRMVKAHKQTIMVINMKVSGRMIKSMVKAHPLVLMVTNI